MSENKSSGHLLSVRPPSFWQLMAIAHLFTVFDNSVVCSLIEDRRPAGIFATLNDATATAHADPSAADNSFIQRSSMLASNPNFEARGSKFLIKHYAGDVLYTAAGMTDKNKDTLIKDILDLIEGSKDPFLHTLFPEKVDHTSKKRPPTAGDRIKLSANLLVENLMKSVYSIRRFSELMSRKLSTTLYPNN